MNFDRLEGNNLILRKAKMDDLEEIWRNIWADQRISEMMLWQITDNLEDAKDRLLKTIKVQKDNYFYFVCLKESDIPIGFANVKEIEDGIFEDCGMCISYDNQGRGYGKEVLSLLLDLVFNKLDANKFIYSCFDINEKSKKLCLFFGFEEFKKEQIVREWDNKMFNVEFYYLDKEKYKYK